MSGIESARIAPSADSMVFKARQFDPPPPADGERVVLTQVTASDQAGVQYTAESGVVRKGDLYTYWSFARRTDQQNEYAQSDGWSADYDRCAWNARASCWSLLFHGIVSSRGKGAGGFEDAASTMIHTLVTTLEGLTGRPVLLGPTEEEVERHAATHITGQAGPLQA